MTTFLLRYRFRQVKCQFVRRRKREQPFEYHLEKGYEKTSIADIAKAIGVAQGLCYRYFPSKEALFDSAIEQYAEELVSRFSVSPSYDKMTLKELIEKMPIMAETKDSHYYKT